MRIEIHVKVLTFILIMVSYSMVTCYGLYEHCDWWFLVMTSVLALTFVVATDNYFRHTFTEENEDGGNK
jgi:hypothetical protein